VTELYSQFSHFTVCTLKTIQL